MRILAVFLAAALFAAFATQLSPSQGANSLSTCSADTGYYVASLNGDIDPGAADFMAASVANAEAACAGHIVFILSTNGGDGGSMESMVDSIGSYHAWNGVFYTLIAPQGARAFSAGSYIAEASDKVYMVPGTTIGAATPIVFGIPTGEENSTLRKDISAFTSYMQALTAANGRNETATALMVTRGASYTNTQALRSHVVDGVLNVTSIQEAIVALGAPESTPIHTPDIRSTLISVLTNPNVSSLLFLIGVFAILADIYHPTLVLSVVGVVVIALALFGLGSFGASPLAVFLMITGAAFIFLEVKTQHGVSAVIGVIIFVVGFLLIFQFPPASPNPSLPAVNFSGIPDLSYALIALIGVSIVIASLYLRSIRQAMLHIPKANDPSLLVGRTGKLETDVSAGGKGVAVVGAEQWSVVSAVELKRGDTIKVKEVKGLELIVEKET